MTNVPRSNGLTGAPKPLECSFMRTVIALFDAPVPVRQVVAALRRLGVPDGDVYLLPSLPGESTARFGVLVEELTDDSASLVPALTDLGLDRPTAHAYAEGVRRGAILLAVRAPILSAPLIQREMESALPLDLALHQAIWAVQPIFGYGWSEVEPPLVDPAPAAWRL